MPDPFGHDGTKVIHNHQYNVDWNKQRDKTRKHRRYTDLGLWHEKTRHTTM